MIEAKVIAHSVAHDDRGNHGPELFTLALKYPRFIHSERDEYKSRKGWRTLCMVASARCARVSYLNHDGSNPDIAKDLDLATKLKDAYHASPFEHVARPWDLRDLPGVVRNFREWTQFRAEIGL